MKNLKYVCCHCHNSFGERQVSKRVEFRTVEGAVEFVKKQKDEAFSWWEVLVEW